MGVGAVLVDGERVLLIRRGHAPRAGAWSVPGGRVDAGERLADAVRREAREETGLEVEPGRLLCLYEYVERTRDGAVGHHYVVADYLCRITGGALRAGSDAAEARWLTLGELHGEDVTEALPALMARAVAVQRRLDAATAAARASVARNACTGHQKPPAAPPPPRGRGTPARTRPPRRK